jgi:Endosomal/lysosomal potassium channel TMEM175
MSDAHDLQIRNAQGFRERGAQVTRLEAFVDAAFAFAVTLLVISFDGLPKSVPELIDAYKGIPAFAVSFLMLAGFWRAHERWSRWYGLDDGRSMALSLLLVFLVLVYVYPLRILFAGFFEFVSRGFFPSDFVVDSYADMRFMFASYAVAYGTLSFVVLLLYWHAWRSRALLGLDALERVQTRLTMLLWGITIAVSVLSFALSLLIGTVFRHSWTMSIPGIAYCAMFLIYPLMLWGERRWRAQEGLPPA